MYSYTFKFLQTIQLAKDRIRHFIINRQRTRCPSTQVTYFQEHIYKYSVFGKREMWSGKLIMMSKWYAHDVKSLLSCCRSVVDCLQMTIAFQPFLSTAYNQEG